MAYTFGIRAEPLFMIRSPPQSRGFEEFPRPVRLCMREYREIEYAATDSLECRIKECMVLLLNGSICDMKYALLQLSNLAR